MRYTVRAEYGKHPPRPGTEAVRAKLKQRGTSERVRARLQKELDLRKYEEKHFARRLVAVAYPLEFKGGKWRMQKGSKTTKVTIKNVLPDDHGSRTKMPNQAVKGANTEVDESSEEG